MEKTGGNSMNGTGMKSNEVGEHNGLALMVQVHEIVLVVDRVHLMQRVPMREEVCKEKYARGKTFEKLFVSNPMLESL